MKIQESKVKQKSGVLVVNFGGPRNLAEIPSFLRSLLCDQEVVRTPLPSLLHKALFSLIAQKRSKKVVDDYVSIGGRSPIFEDTESVAEQLRKKIDMPVMTFHRYLPQTHPKFIQEMLISDVKQWTVFPMFPQFSYATTGSIAKWMKEKLPREIVRKLSWIKSYPSHPAFSNLFAQRIKDFISLKQLQEKDCLLFYSAHGIPKKFVLKGDPYQLECESSFQKISAHFKKGKNILAYQSKFGPGQWLKPYTVDVCENIQDYIEDKTTVIFIPLAFTSDHIETLFEIETEYLPLVTDKGYKAFRLPAFNNQADWVAVISEIISGTPSLCSNQMLVR